MTFIGGGDAGVAAGDHAVQDLLVGLVERALVLAFDRSKTHAEVTMCALNQLEPSRVPLRVARHVRDASAGVGLLAQIGDREA